MSNRGGSSIMPRAEKMNVSDIVIFQKWNGRCEMINLPSKGTMKTHSISNFTTRPQKITKQLNPIVKPQLFKS